MQQNKIGSTIDDANAALLAVLNALMAAREEARRRSEDQAPEPLRLVSMADHAGQPLPTRDAALLKRLARNPAEGAYRHAIRKIGRIIHEIGGDEAMREADAMVSRKGGDNAGRMLAVINAAWNGIGSWIA